MFEYLGAKKLVANPDPTCPIKIHYIEEKNFASCFSFITSNGNGLEFSRMFFGPKEPIPLSPEINTILKEVGSPDNLRVYSRVIEMKSGERTAISYIVGFDTNGKMSWNILGIRGDGAKIPADQVTIAILHERNPIVYPSIEELKSLVPIKPKADIGTSSQTAK